MIISLFQSLLMSTPHPGGYIITHAPVAPWFSPIYPNGAYLTVHEQVGSLIDWYNIQFYNRTHKQLLQLSVAIPNSSPSRGFQRIYHL